MITFGDYNHHWSYYLSIENQLEETYRFVDFSESNMETYSIEFARILLAASSEADVVLKQFCRLLDDNSKADKIGAYQPIIDNSPAMNQEVIHINRYNIDLKPWENFSHLGVLPTWWTANNKVKHHRHTHFKYASLRNAMHSVGALHILITYFYKSFFEKQIGSPIPFESVTSALQPRAGLFSLDNRYYSRTRRTHSEF